MAERARVGVRELRQNLSKYLRRIDAGETLVVTENRRPVAILSPLPEGMTRYQRMIAEGLVRPPEEDADLLDIEPAKGPVLMPLSEALELQRRERLP
jgi:antitoxin (DNA-binding transcriptional repressor) of toxin-antitoxin stability system